MVGLGWNVMSCDRGGRAGACGQRRMVAGTTTWFSWGSAPHDRPCLLPERAVLRQNSWRFKFLFTMAKHSKNLHKSSRQAAASRSLEVSNRPDSGIRPCWLHGMVAFALAGVCALLYAWTVDFPMEFDDAVYLQNNPLVRDAASFGYLNDVREFVARPMKMGLEPDLATNFILRPVAYLTFHLNYLFDGYNPRWYRAGNIAVHAGNAILIYALLTVLLGGGRRKRELSPASVAFVAATAALLFAVHPLATESVTYVVQRFTSLGAFFYLLTLWVYFVAGTVKQRAARWLLTGVAVLTLLVGMLTKECSITAPLLAVFLDWFLIGVPLRRALARAIPLLLCLPVIPSLILLTAWGKGNGVLHLSDAANLTNSVERPISHWHYLVTQTTVVADYLRRLVWPSGLNLDPEWTLRRSLLEGPVVRSLIIMGSVVLFCWRLHRRNRQDVRGAGAFVFAVWFFATIAISSGLIPLPDLMAEHRSYLPSVGFFAALACMLDWFRTGRRGRWAAPLAVLTCAMVLGWATWQRNEVWRTKISLWKDTTEKSPGKYRAWNNLGEAYSSVGQREQAVECFRKTISLEPLCWAAHINLAGMLNELSRYKESYEVTMATLRANRAAEQSADVRYNLAVSYLGLGNTDLGIKMLKELVTLAPDHRPSRVVLGLVYSQSHQPRLALDQWQRAVALKPASLELAGLMRQEQEVLKREEAENLRASSALR